MKKNLIISVIGRPEHYKTWFAGPSEKCNYDVILIIYNNLIIPDEIKARCRAIYDWKGFKWKLIKKLFTEEIKPNEYLYYWLTDDDIEMKPDAINHIFDEMFDCNIHLCQPALEPDKTRHSWGAALNKRDGMEFHTTKFIEVMTPFMSQRFLKIVLEFCDENCSGWGVDFVWSKIAAEMNFEMRVYDKYCCRHASIQEDPKSDMYRKLKKEGVDFTNEFHKIITKYKALDYFKMVLKKYMNYNLRT